MSISDVDGRIKLGRTDSHPEIRAVQLSRQTAATGSFKVEWFKEVENSELMENNLKDIFKNFNYNKEFYNINLELAKEIAEDFCQKFISIKNDIIEQYKEKIEHNNKRIKALAITEKLFRKNKDIEHLTKTTLKIKLIEDFNSQIGLFVFGKTSDDNQSIPQSKK